MSLGGRPAVGTASSPVSILSASKVVMNESAIRRIPLAQPSIGERERELVAQVMESGILALGPFAKRFEEACAALAGRRFGVSCNSGTAGLHMIVRALGIGQDDEVITTPFSFVASANCMMYERAVPRFVDIEEDTLGMDPNLLADAFGPRTRAVLLVQVFGRASRIKAIQAFAEDRGVPLIEDSCEALGSAIGGRPLGSFGVASVFAFYPNKQITTGEGGMVVTDDPVLEASLRSLRNQGRDEDGTWLRHIQLGFNYRLDELSAAIGVAQLERLSELASGRARVAAEYERSLSGMDWLKLPAPAPDESVDWFVYVVRLDPGIDRDRVIDALAARGIASRPYFSPIHLQPFYRETFGYAPGDFPVTERVAASTLALPFSAVLSSSDVAHVAAVLIDVVGSHLRR